MEPKIIDTMYYYNPKYPEYGIEELPLTDIKWVKSVLNEENMYIYSVTSPIDIQIGHEVEFGRTYYIYNPYVGEEDKDMFAWDMEGNRQRIMSFNKEKLTEWWEEEVRVAKTYCMQRLEDLEKCLNQK